LIAAAAAAAVDHRRSLHLIVPAIENSYTVEALSVPDPFLLGFTVQDFLFSAFASRMPTSWAFVDTRRPRAWRPLVHRLNAARLSTMRRKLRKRRKTRIRNHPG
jgi:hypothetical protein